MKILSILKLLLVSLIVLLQLIVMENLYTSIRPFYKVLKFFGLFPMNFEGPIRNGNLKITKLSMINTIILFGVLASTMANIIMNHIKFEEEKQPFLGMIIWSWFLIFIYPVIIIQLIIQMTVIKDIRNYFKFMHEIDKKMRGLFVKIDHVRHQKVIFWSTIFFLFTIIARFIASLFNGMVYGVVYATKGNLVVQEFSYVCFLFSETFFILQFVFPTYLIRERFRILTDLLR